MFDYTKISAEDYKLLDLGVLDLRGSTNGDDMAPFVRQALLYLKTKGSPDITIEITSYGGDSGAGLKIYDMLKDYSGKKTAKIIGFADSMALVIVQACDHKQCLRHSVCVAHYLAPNKNRQAHLGVLTNKKELRQLIEFLEEDQKRIDTIFLKMTKMNKAQLKKILKEEKGLESEKLLELGLIDEIID